VNFHPNGDLLLVAGEDKYMRFFRIDGDKNEKQLAVRVNDMIIQNATFRSTAVGSSGTAERASSGVRGAAEEVVLCGRKPFFYSYDTESGNIAKIPGTVPIVCVSVSGVLAARPKSVKVFFCAE
jgi:U3 small nucleolar RNA-associated protein 18